MSSRKGLSAVDLESLRAFDTCTVSNAIERLSARLRNEGFISRRGALPVPGSASDGRLRRDGTNSNRVSADDPSLLL